MYYDEHAAWLKFKNEIAAEPWTGEVILEEFDILKHRGRFFSDIGIDPSTVVAADTTVVVTKDRALVTYTVSEWLDADLVRQAIERNSEMPAEIPEELRGDSRISEEE